MLSKKVLLLRIDGVVVARALRRTNFWNPTVPVVANKLTFDGGC